MKIFILGFGTMGKAIGQKLAAHRGFKVYAANRDPKKLLGQKNIAADNSFKHLPECEFVIVAVKPQDIAVLAASTRELLNPKSILVSIAAGMSMKKLGELFSHVKIARIIPTLALTVGQGIALWRGAGLSEAEKKKTEALFSRFTEYFEVKNESLIDRGSVIYGCGPAFFFFFADSLRKAARKLGFDEKQSRRLVEKTFLGSALLQKGQDYQVLIKRVASKKGITQAGLKIFVQQGFNKIVERAAVAGYKRAQELSK